MFKKTSIILFIAVLLFAAISLGLIIYLKQIGISNQHKYSGSNTPSAVLSQISASFATAQQDRQDENYTAALNEYQNSLPDAQDALQKEQINYNIALMQMYSGNFSSAIQGLKQVAADQQTNDQQTKAYAVQQMGIMYYTYTNDDSAISNDIFTGTPYGGFLQGSNISLAYRHLFEYAVSFYPVGYSEAMIAQWYANDLTQTLNGATTTPQGISDIKIIQSDLANANTDVQNTKSNTVTGVFVPAILNREGIVLGKMASVGVGTYQQAESYFQQSLQYDAVFANKAGSFDAYNYASFLATTYGKSRASDIDKILVPFQVGNDANIDSRVATFYTVALTSPTYSQQKAIIAKLGNIDPTFKTYLISLGWNANDF